MTLSVLVVPNAKHNEIIGWHDRHLKVRIAAPPIEGRANTELTRFLAQKFHLTPSEVRLEKGLGSKYKRVDLPVSPEELHSLIP